MRTINILTSRDEVSGEHSLVLGHEGLRDQRHGEEGGDGGHAGQVGGGGGVVLAHDSDGQDGRGMGTCWQVIVVVSG